jgi:hypothetical protein
MTVFFFEPCGAEQPGVVNFPGCTEIVQDGKEVQARIDGKDFCLATIEAKRSLTLFTIHPQAYAAVFGCPMPERPWTFWSLRITN